MFENNLLASQNIHFPDDDNSARQYGRKYSTALNQFRSTLRKGNLFRLKGKILNRQHCLYDLNILKSSLCVQGSFYAGIQVVPISAIIGSEGKITDFDMQFHPLSESSRERWVNMAIVYLSRLPLPPVQLIQVGEAYFVRDGHHRISVSRSFGQIAIDAEVISWKASPPFPWQADATRERTYPLKGFNLSTWLG
ncbi:MAG TPA: hypothetical protein VK249_12165 [Anaerolineales bacterium]|nr:hypothetical protein [Anaerolineales bacterium]